jgi:hypothetical protein
MDTVIIKMGMPLISERFVLVLCVVISPVLELSLCCASQVNVATRDAALAPGAIDSMSFFEGAYALAPLNSKTAMAPVEVAISSHNGEPVVQPHFSCLVCVCAS